MRINKIYSYVGIIGLLLMFSSCVGPIQLSRKENKSIPSTYNNTGDSLNSVKTNWKDFFKDQNLVNLIDSALIRNQELNITMLEINISQNEARARKAAYLPTLNVVSGVGVEKVGKYTSQGASDDVNDITPGKKVPTELANLMLGVNVSWELDIWRKLRNSRKAAINKYLASIEGKNFMVTNLIAEIATSYYELMALDNQLDVLKKNIELYQNSLKIVILEKQSARVTELAVRRFEAEVLKNQSRQFYIEQNIVETENRINFLVGRFPQKVVRNSQDFNNLKLDSLHQGIPSQLLENRPDIRKAENELMAAKLDVKSARANFYPSLIISAGLGYGAFNPAYLIKTPESLLNNIVGNIVAPLINRNAIKANYYSANSKQLQAVYNYERAILNAHIEVVNQLSNLSNLKKSYDLKSKQVNALTLSIEISNVLFKSARADYMEVLLTQRDAMESRFELVETQKQQLNARVNIYRALGGGWR